MKRILMVMLAITVLLMASACGGGDQPADPPPQETPAETVVGASAYIEQLWSALEASGFPVEELGDGSTSEGKDEDIGEYLYTGYIVTDGVYVSTYETPDQTELLQVQVMMDMSIAQRDQISSGAFAISNMVYYFDTDGASSILEDLNVEDFTSAGISEASGQNGTYKYIVDSGNLRIFLVYTLAN